MLLWTVPAQGALRYGLGDAVARRSADLINKAGTVVGPNGEPLLPSCGSNMALFTTPPVTDPSWIAIEPLGHFAPPGHTFPSDHNYYDINASSTALLGVNQYAPADGWITQVITLYGTGNTSAGYVLTFSPCAEVTWNNMSVNTLAPALGNPASGSNTTCYSNGQNFPGAVASCTTTLQLPVKAGQLLGTGGLVDFGPIVDTRMQIQGFIDPGRHNLNRGFCVLNYFVPSLQTTYTAMLGAMNGSTVVPRTIPPLCGTIMQDIPGTVQGDWYFPGAPNIPEDPHLALVHHNVVPSTGTFSCGTSIPAFTGSHDFNPKTSADGTRINYDFGLVRDNQIYCYDTLLEDFNWGAGGPDPLMTGHIVLLQMSGSSLDTLKIEFQNPGTTCTGAGTWAFTGAAVTFQR
jgi:hypothetical protein